MPKELKNYTRRELDAMTWGEVKSLASQLYITHPKGANRAAFTDMVEAALNVRFGEPTAPVTQEPKQDLFKLAALDAAEDAEEEPWEEMLRRTERLCEHQEQAAQEESLHPSPIVGIKTLLGAVVGVESGFDPIPDATERVEIPHKTMLPPGIYTSMDIGMEDLTLCLEARTRASRQAETFLRSAEWLGGGEYRLSLPRGDGGHDRVIIALPNCLAVRARPADVTEE